MNFTREPIIETIITPKEGFKLVIRSSRDGSEEEYTVDAVEIVSFGKSMFFRSLERPKAFLLPVSDFEVIETKETRVVLKNAPMERSIKIAGGNKNPARPQREHEEKEGQPRVEGQQRSDGDKPRRKKSPKRRKMNENEGGEMVTSPKLAIAPPQLGISPPPHSHEERKEHKEHREHSSTDAPKEEGPKLSSSMFKNLIPPPPGLISKNMQRKENAEPVEKTFFTEDVMPKPAKEETEETSSEEDNNNVKDSTPLFPAFEKEGKDAEEKEMSEEDKKPRPPRYHEAPKDSQEAMPSQEAIAEEEVRLDALYKPETNLV